MAQGQDAVERHQAEAARLRSEIEVLVRQARLLLNGDAYIGRPPPPAVAKRAEREKELESCLEKVDWHRREIKRLRQELENRDQVAASLKDPRDRDPMELQNLLAERRRELQKLQHSGEGLDRVASAQRRAEAEQNALRPEVEEKLSKMRREVEQQKRKHAKLQADRLKLSSARKAAEEELRAANSEVRSRAAQLQPPPPSLAQRPPRLPGGAGGGCGIGSPTAQPAATPASGGTTNEEPKTIRQLRQNVEILREALRQDERRFKGSQKEDCQEIEFASNHVAELQQSIADREAEVAKLQAQLSHGGQRPSIGDNQDKLPETPAAQETGTV
mmetsp:Transcript_107232/g.277474  ORF Transcript_107232/g.277474 Transcript_107232/m.277474 type:complete len:331 (-) Transcript_107232:112-1104(-)